MTLHFPTERHLDEIGQDKFQFKVISEKLLHEVIKRMQSPNCLGIYGNWGSGKSTLLHFIQQQIQDEPINELVPVYFEPWKYEYAENGDLLFALLSKIKEKLQIDNKEWKETMAALLTVGSWALRMLPVPMDPQIIKNDFDIYKNG